MKYSVLQILIVFVLITGSLKAQNLIAIQNGGEPEFYTSLDSAVTNAIGGDTIYIPGGTFMNNSILEIDKELHLIGVGHNPDSTLITHMTYLWSSIRLKYGSSYSTFEGFYLTGEFIIGGSPSDQYDANVNHLKISRVNCGNIIFGKNCSGWDLYENVIRGIITTVNSFPRSQFNFFSNNIFCEGVCCFEDSQFNNNIFIKGGYWANNVHTFTNCIFQNNVFLDGIGNEITGCVFDNNLLYHIFSLPTGSLGSNNIFLGYEPWNVFVDYPGGIFDYSYNFHLIPAGYGINAGSDGTDIGIYGGMFPWKEGSLPPNPHIQYKLIQQSTDQNGNLNVNIKVAAQDN